MASLFFNYPDATRSAPNSLEGSDPNPMEGSGEGPVGLFGASG